MFVKVLISLNEIIVSITIEYSVMDADEISDKYI